MNAITRYILKIGMIVILFPLRLLPIKKNKVVLLNDIMNQDADFSSNPKYIALYIKQNYSNDFELIYPIGKGSSVDEAEDLGIKTVRLKSLAYFYHVMTCGFFLTTSGGISYIPFRESQTVINTWHGGGAYKKMALDIEDDEHLRKALKISESKTTYFLSSNKMFSDIVESAFLMPQEKILPYGLPRNDVFFKDTSEVNAKVRSYYNLDDDVNLAMYAPTYRSSNESIFKKHTLGPYDLDYNKTLEALSKRFGGKWILGIRLHPSISHLEMNLPDNIINMSAYEDIQELMCTASVLINDYSSTMWDFSMTRKPCFIFATDLENYDTNLGFYTSPQSWPFPLTENNDELEDAILNFNLVTYEKDLSEYFNWMGNYDLGNACQLTVDKMIEELRGK